MSNQWIYDKVSQLVAKYQTHDPFTLIEQLGIKILYLNAPKKLLGVYKVILRNRFIFLANNLGALEKIVLAHELGHDQLHRKYCLKGASFHENQLFQPIDRMEIEANIFAAHLLISDKEVLTLIQNGMDSTLMAYELGVDIHLVNLKISELCKMKKLPSIPSTLQTPHPKFLGKYIPLGDDWPE